MAMAPTIATATEVRLDKPVTIRVAAWTRHEAENSTVQFVVGNRVVLIDASPAFVVALLGAALEAAECEYPPEPTVSPS